MASKQKPLNGRRSRQPLADAAAVKPSARIVSVRSRRPSFNRAGLRFTAAEPVTVREAEIGPDRFAAIINEPQLRCEEIQA
jgi:hypothetical protein